MKGEEHPEATMASQVLVTDPRKRLKDTYDLLS